MWGRLKEGKGERRGEVSRDGGWDGVRDESTSRFDTAARAAAAAAAATAVVPTKKRLQSLHCLSLTLFLLTDPHHPLPPETLPTSLAHTRFTYHPIAVFKKRPTAAAAAAAAARSRRRRRGRHHRRDRLGGGSGGCLLMYVCIRIG